LTLFADNLFGRNFCVKIGTHFSEPKSVSSGVPQGSILGPLLFIAYIADLPEFCKTDEIKIKLFADDLKAYLIFSPNASHHIPLQNFINKLSTYSDINGLEIAINKCTTMHIGTKNPNHSYSLNNSTIPNVVKGEPVRDLGIYFTSDLKWITHIEIIVKKSRRVSFALLRSLKTTNPQTLINLFKIYVLPIIEFCCHL
jgi:hypothetical protein